MQVNWQDDIKKRRYFIILIMSFYLLFILYFITLTQAQGYDPHCAQYTNGFCSQCINFFYIKNNICTEISTNCADYNNITGECTSCIQGFTFNNGKCLDFSQMEKQNQSQSAVNQSTTTIPINEQISTIQQAFVHLTPENNPYGYPPNFQDPYCQRFDNNNYCIQCAVRFYFNKQSGLCTPISNQCNTFNQTSGSCLSCYQGYSLNNGNCTISTIKQNTINSYFFCKMFINNVCISCYEDNVLVNGICVSPLSLCQSVDSHNNCISCYSGYTLKNGRCLIVSTQGCSKFDTRGRCIQCSKGFYFQGGVCIQSNPLCQTFNEVNGACLSCYSGYILNGNLCIIGVNMVLNDQNCAQFKNGKCERCSFRFVLKQAKCHPVNDYCNTYNNITGDCTSCYSGFLLKDGFCYKTIIVPITQTVTQRQPQLTPQKSQIKSQLQILGQHQIPSLASKNIFMPITTKENNNITSEQIFYKQLNKDNSVMIPKFLTQTSLISSISNSNINNQSLIHSGNPCLKYDFDGITCLQCSISWALLNGNCLLRQIYTPKIYPIEIN